MTTTTITSLAIIFLDIVLIIIIHNVNKLGRDVLEKYKHCLDCIKETREHIDKLAESHNKLVQAFNDMVDKHNRLADRVNDLNQTIEQNGKD